MPDVTQSSAKLLYHDVSSEIEMQGLDVVLGLTVPADG